jgi:hypothetical protein
MNVEIGTGAAQFPEKEYINVIFIAVRMMLFHHVSCGMGKKSSSQVTINCILSVVQLLNTRWKQMVK